MQAGKIILFGSGESSPTGRAIHWKVFSSLGKKKHRVAILETPAGFQPNSPDNPAIVTPLESSDVIFLGPGSPTYALKQRRGSLAWKLIVSRWKQGVMLSLASAAILAVGKQTLVYPSHW